MSNNNVTTLPSPTKPQTIREVIADNVKLLIEQLEAGKSEALTTYLTAMGRFRNYSFGNILEIARQKPTATRVAGMKTWNDLGRRVKKGEKGIRILAPLMGTRKKKEQTDPAVRNEPFLLGFRSVPVFDIEQTEGAELPKLTEKYSGSVGDYKDRLLTFADERGIEVEYRESIAPATGTSHGGMIALLPGQEPAEEFGTLVHELAHELLHQAERSIATTKAVRETEAEAIAFVVAKAVGLKPGNAAADYIHLYHGSSVMLTESLSVIQRTSAIILSAIEDKIEEAATEELSEVA